MKKLTYLRIVVALLIVSIFNTPLIYAKSNQRLDINKATVSELIPIKGIGKVKAKAIVNFIRKRNGIRYMNELLKVKGVGPKTLKILEQKFEVKSKGYKKSTRHIDFKDSSILP